MLLLGSNCPASASRPCPFGNLVRDDFQLPKNAITSKLKMAPKTKVVKRPAAVLTPTQLLVAIAKKAVEEAKGELKEAKARKKLQELQTQKENITMKLAVLNEGEKHTEKKHKKEKHEKKHKKEKHHKEKKHKKDKEMKAIEDKWFSEFEDKE